MRRLREAKRKSNEGERRKDERFRVERIRV